MCRLKKLYGWDNNLQISKISYKYILHISAEKNLNPKYFVYVDERISGVARGGTEEAAVPPAEILRNFKKI